MIENWILDITQHSISLYNTVRNAIAEGNGRMVYEILNTDYKSYLEQPLLQILDQMTQGLRIRSAEHESIKSNLKKQLKQFPAGDANKTAFNATLETIIILHKNPANKKTPALLFQEISKRRSPKEEPRMDNWILDTHRHLTSLYNIVRNAIDKGDGRLLYEILITDYKSYLDEKLFLPLDQIIQASKVNPPDNDSVKPNLEQQLNNFPLTNTNEKIAFDATLETIINLHQNPSDGRPPILLFQENFKNRQPQKDKGKEKISQNPPTVTVQLRPEKVPETKPKSDNTESKSTSISQPTTTEVYKEKTPKPIRKINFLLSNIQMKMIEELKTALVKYIYKIPQDLKEHPNWNSIAKILFNELKTLNNIERSFLNKINQEESTKDFVRKTINSSLEMIHNLPCDHPHIINLQGCFTKAGRNYIEKMPLSTRQGEILARLKSSNQLDTGTREGFLQFLGQTNPPVSPELLNGESKKTYFESPRILFLLGIYFDVADADEDWDIDTVLEKAKKIPTHPKQFINSFQEFLLGKKKEKALLTDIIYRAEQESNPEKKECLILLYNAIETRQHPDYIKQQKRAEFFSPEIVSSVATYINSSNRGEEKTKFRKLYPELCADMLTLLNSKIINDPLLTIFRNFIAGKFDKYNLLKEINKLSTTETLNQKKTQLENIAHFVTGRIDPIFIFHADDDAEPTIRANDTNLPNFDHIPVPDIVKNSNDKQNIIPNDNPDLVKEINRELARGCFEIGCGNVYSEHLPDFNQKIESDFKALGIHEDIHFCRFLLIISLQIKDKVSPISFLFTAISDIVRQFKESLTFGEEIDIKEDCKGLMTIQEDREKITVDDNNSSVEIIFKVPLIKFKDSKEFLGNMLLAIKASRKTDTAEPSFQLTVLNCELQLCQKTIHDPQASILKIFTNSINTLASQKQKKGEILLSLEKNIVVLTKARLALEKCINIMKNRLYVDHIKADTDISLLLGIIKNQAGASAIVNDVRTKIAKNSKPNQSQKLFERAAHVCSILNILDPKAESLDGLLDPPYSQWLKMLRLMNRQPMLAGALVTLLIFSLLSPFIFSPLFPVLLTFLSFTVAGMKISGVITAILVIALSTLTGASIGKLIEIHNRLELENEIGKILPEITQLCLEIENLRSSSNHLNTTHSLEENQITETETNSPSTTSSSTDSLSNLEEQSALLIAVKDEETQGLIPTI